MKTPRELLLNRHRDKVPKLDALREQVFANELSRMQADAMPGASLAIRVVLAFWNELILPARHTWAGLAAAWIVILAINTADSDGFPTAHARVASSPAEIAAAIREQQRLMAELAGVPEMRTPERPQPAMPKPRSSRRTETSLV